MSTVAHFFMIMVAQKFVITWLTFSLTFTTNLLKHITSKELHDEFIILKKSNKLSSVLV